MLFTSWMPYTLKRSVAWQHSGARRRAHWRHPRLPTIALLIEALESRQLLTVIEVTTTADAVVPDSETSLREAILQARSASDPVFIALGSGTFTLAMGSGDDAGEVGDLDVFNPNQLVTIQGAGHDQTIIDGGGLDRVFHILPGAVVRIENLTIQHGVNVPDESGGGILNEGQLTLSQVFLRGNSSSRSGGGIFNSEAGGLGIEDSRLEMNQAINGGAAVFNLGQAAIINSLVIGNSQPSPSSQGTPSGALANVGSMASLEVVSSEVVGSFGSLRVGGIHNQEGTVYLQQSTLNNNVGLDFGGAFNEFGHFTVLNSTFANNQGGQGGAIQNQGTMDVSYSTIIDNSSPSGNGGIISAPGATTTLANSIVARITDLSSPEVDLTGSFQSLGSNLVGDPGMSTGLDTGLGDRFGTDAAPLDPKLQPLGDYSHDAFSFSAASMNSLVPPMLTYLPMLGSPAIDAAMFGQGPTIDQYNHPRGVFGGLDFKPDIGAVERFFGTIRGRAFDDENENGERDNDEPLIGNVMAKLLLSPLAPGITSTVSATGEFIFTMLPQPAELFVKITAPDGFLAPIPPIGVTLHAESSEDSNFVYHSIAVGDVNRDGLEDVVLGGELVGNDAAVSVFLMMPDGRFEASTCFTIPGKSKVFGVALADLNGDGHLDLVATVDDQAILFRNDGAGTFTAETTELGIGSDPGIVVTGDFNHDGKPDFAVANSFHGQLQIRHTDGDFGITDGFSLMQGGFLSDLIAGPNGELLLTNLELGTVTLFRESGGSLVQDFQITGLIGPVNAVVDDFLGDGIPDLAVATDSGVQIYPDVLLQGPSPTDRWTIDVSGGRLLSEDFDQDFLPDLAIADAEGVLQFLQNMGNGRFNLTFSRPLAVDPSSIQLIGLPRLLSNDGGQGTSPGTGQIDGSRRDLVALSFNGHTFKVLANTSGLFPVTVSDAGETLFDLPLVRPALLSGLVELTGAGPTTPLPNVTVYIDRNQNKRLDEFEAFTVTRQDDSRTSVNEAGTFSLSVRPGEMLLRVVPPEGRVVLVPNDIEFGNAYHLSLNSGEVAANLNFLLEVPSGRNSAPTIPIDADMLTNSVPEGALNGSRVGITLQATDPDGDVVFYRLTDDAGGRFVIDPLTGVVTVKQGQLLVAANAAQHTIKAQAVDSKGLASAEVEFEIQVTAVPVNALPIATILPNRADVVERDQGPNFINFRVQLNKASTQTITIDFSTFVGTDPNFLLPEGIAVDTPFATDNPASPDFFRTSGRLTFAPGVTEQSLRVQIAPDNMPEMNELFFVQLHSPVNAQLSAQQRVAIARILDDDSFPQLVVSDTRSLEGDAPGQNELAFTVQLIGEFPPGASTATVDFSTGNPIIDNAVAGTDYTFQSGTLTFTEATRVQVVRVPIIGNLLDEADKTVSLRFTNEQGLGLSRSEVRGTIVNDDSPNVVLSISSQVVREQNAGNQLVELVVTLVGKPTGTVTANFTTVNGSAMAGTDFRARSGTLEFAPGEIQKSIFVSVLGDTLVEKDEVFTVNLSLPPGLPQPNVAIDPENGVGRIVIRNDDQAVLTEDGDAIVEQLTADLTEILDLGGGVKNNPALITEMQRRAVLIAQQLGLTKAIIIIIDPVDFVLNDAANRQSGYTANTGVVNQIPGTYYSGDGTVELLIVPTPPDGTYNVQLVGIGGDFNASITVVDGNQATTTTVSNSLANGSTLSVAVQVGNANIPRTVGLGLAAANASAGVGVVGSLGNQGVELALARAAEQWEAEIWNLDNPNWTPLDRIFALFTIAVQVRDQIFEGLRLSLESPFGDLIEQGEDLREGLPAALIDQLWRQLGQMLIGVPHSVYRLGDMLEMFVSKGLRPSGQLRNSPPSDQAPMPNGTGVRLRARVNRSSLQRAVPVPASPPAQPTEKSGPQLEGPSKPRNTTTQKSPPTPPSSDTAQLERLWNLWFAPRHHKSPTPTPVSRSS